MKSISPFIARTMQIMAEIAEAVPMKVWRGESDIPVVTKSDGSPVTEYDSRTEYMLIERLQKLLPGSQVIGEETVGKDDAWKASPLLQSKGDVWIVDPIDGTYYFARKEPFGMLLGLRQKGVMQFAIAYYPVEQEFLWATQEGDAAFHCTIKDGVLSAPRIVEMPVIAAKDITLGYYVGPQAGASVDDILEPAIVAEFKSSYDNRCIATSMRRMLLSGDEVCVNGVTYTPWDYETTALIARAAGAVVTHCDGAEAATTQEAGDVVFAPSRDISRLLHQGIKRPQAVL